MSEYVSGGENILKKAALKRLKQVIIDTGLEKASESSVLEQEGAKGAYTSTPQGKCDYVRKAESSQAVIDFYCKALDEQKKKSRETGKEEEGRKDIRDRLKKRAAFGSKEISEAIVLGALRGGVSGGIGGVLGGIDSGELGGKSVAHKGIIPGIVGQLVGDYSAEHLSDEARHLQHIAPAIGYAIGAYRGFREKKKKEELEEAKESLAEESGSPLQEKVKEKLRDKLKRLLSKSSSAKKKKSLIGTE